MTKQEFYTELDAILGVLPGTTQGDEALADLPGWDSMSVLSVIQMVDSKLGVVISASGLLNCKQVSDLIGLCGDRVTV